MKLTNLKRLNIKYRSDLRISSGILTLLAYGTCIYAIVVTLTNIANLFGVFNFQVFYMRDTFLGLSLLVIIVTQEALSELYSNKLIGKLRPVIIGITTATIIALCQFKLFLLWLTIVGLLLLIKNEKKNCFKDLYVESFAVIIGLEVYSILYLIFGYPAENIISNVLQSFVLDIILLVHCIVPSIINKKYDASLFKRESFFYAIRLLGGTVAACAIGTFLFYFTVTQSSFERVDPTQGNTYILRNEKDSSQVLTLNTETNNVLLSDYTGANNQKFTLEYADNGQAIFRFMSTELVLTRIYDPITQSLVATAKVWNDLPEQKWYLQSHGMHVEMYSEENIRVNLYEMERSAGRYFLVANSFYGQCFTLEQSIPNEFISSVKLTYEELFQPVPFYEVNYFIYGELTIVIFIVIASVFVLSFYLVVKKKRIWILIYNLLFAYALLYGDVNVMFVIVAIMFMVELVKKCFLAHREV